ncbi:DUF1254 domain-containing protein [Dyella amyloliquefaciens]|uniref:DUF1254 domain-containing protein n=1 Tax=Dyella amyloliquefaciens TaxID=1770545 RepID=UPI00197A7615|nr:DUF1254 domain-containing protein [Dyella amyloliquefaciens]
MEPLKEPGRLSGSLPVAPVNHLSMLTDYIEPQERDVTCPNQDVVYGSGPLVLDKEPVVVQVPDFGDRFWVYQVVDIRTDSFANLGKMYGTKPGFYLLVGPDWKGTVPKGITQVFRSGSNTGFIVPRVFMDDTSADRTAIQPLIASINIYPLSQFDGKMKHFDWTHTPSIPGPPPSADGGEAPKVIPGKFLDELPTVLQDAKPLPGEEAWYAQAKALVAAAKANPALRAAIDDELAKTEREVVAPLLDFHNYGMPLPNHWTVARNGAQFGTDYFTRTGVARSNIFVNKPNEASYFYQDFDANGARLDGSKRYTVTFPKGTPPVKGFWSITMYDSQHFFVSNAIKRYSVGTKNKDLKLNADGSLTLYIQAEQPTDAAQRANWLPSPSHSAFSLYIRTYWPDQEVLDDRWTPPPVLAGR